MEEIRIVLTIGKCKNVNVHYPAEGEIGVDAYVGDKHFGRIYPFGNECPSFDRMFRAVVKSTRSFLHEKGFERPIPPPLQSIE